MRAMVETQKGKDLEIAKDKQLMYRDQLCVPKDEGLQNEIMTVAHSALMQHTGIEPKCIEIYVVHF